MNACTFFTVANAAPDRLGALGDGASEADDLMSGGCGAHGADIANDRCGERHHVECRIMWTKLGCLYCGNEMGNERTMK